jgi:hypothetical protein
MRSELRDFARGPRGKAQQVAHLIGEHSGRQMVPRRFIVKNAFT